MPRRVIRPNRPVFSNRPSRLKADKRRLPWGLVLKVAVIIAILVAGGSWFKINQVSVSGMHTLDSAAIRKQTQVIMASRLGWNNLLIIDSGGLGKALILKEPQLKTVMVERHWPHTLIVKVTEKQPTVNWQTGGRVYLLDIDGSIIGLVDATHSSLPTIIDTANLPVQAGQRVVGPHFMRFIEDLLNQFHSQTSLQIIGLSVPSTTSELYVTTGKGYTVKFDTAREASEQINDLKLVLTQLDREHKHPAEYIDLRIAHKAYYK